MQASDLVSTTTTSNIVVIRHPRQIPYLQHLFDISDYDTTSDNPIGNSISRYPAGVIISIYDNNRINWAWTDLAYFKSSPNYYNSNYIELPLHIYKRS